MHGIGPWTLLSPCAQDASQPVHPSVAIHPSGSVINLPSLLWCSRPSSHWSKLYFRINRDFPQGGRKQSGQRLATRAKRKANKYLFSRDAGGQQGRNPVNTDCVPDQQVDGCQHWIFKEKQGKRFLIYTKLSNNKVSSFSTVEHPTKETGRELDGVSFIHTLFFTNDAKKEEAHFHIFICISWI